MHDFMHDFMHHHTEHIIMEYLHTYEIRFWPAPFLEFTLIIHIWDMFRPATPIYVLSHKFYPIFHDIHQSSIWNLKSLMIIACL